MNLTSPAEVETWYDKYNHLMVDLRDPRYVSRKAMISMINFSYKI